MAKPTHSQCLPLLALVLLLCTLGCSAGSEGVSVTGEITYRDQPITEGSLAFYPSKGRPTITAISADGSFECRLPVGDYRVTVTIGVKLPPGWKEGDPVPPRAIRLPPAYGSRVKTPIKVSITESRSEPLDLKLQ